MNKTSIIPQTQTFERSSYTLVWERQLMFDEIYMGHMYVACHFDWPTDR